MTRIPKGSSDVIVLQPAFLFGGWSKSYPILSSACVFLLVSVSLRYNLQSCSMGCTTLDTAPHRDFTASQIIAIRKFPSHGSQGHQICGFLQTPGSSHFKIRWVPGPNRAPGDSTTKPACNQLLSYVCLFPLYS